MDRGELEQMKDVIANDGLDRCRTQQFDLVRFVGGVRLMDSGFFVHSTKVAGAFNWCVRFVGCPAAVFNLAAKLGNPCGLAASSLGQAETMDAQARGTVCYGRRAVHSK